MGPNIENNNTAPQQRQPRRTFISCLIGLIPLLIILIFIFAGKYVFGFFHIGNIYNFILSILIILFVYTVGLIVISLSIRYPKDLLTILIDRISKF